MEFIKNMMEAELHYIYTNNPAFDDYINREYTAEEKKSELVRSHPLIVILRKRVEAYYKVVVKNLRDLVPKNIKHTLLKKAV